MIVESREPGARTEGGAERRRRGKSKSGGPATVTVTGRGGVALLFGLSLVGALVGWSFLPGLAFAAGCVLAALTVKPADLPGFVATPPVVFFVATLLAETAHALGGKSFLQSLAVALPLKLGGGAPWLFAGSLLAVAIAWRRGLLIAWRELNSRAADFRLTIDRSTEEDPVRWDD